MNTQFRFHFVGVVRDSLLFVLLMPFRTYIQMGKWLRLVYLRRLFVLVSSRKDRLKMEAILPVHLELPGTKR